MEQIINLLASPNVSGSAAALLLVLIVTMIQLRKFYRNDSGEQTVDTTYKNILAIMKAQNDECHEQHRLCEERVQRLAQRIDALEAARGNPY